MEKRDIVIVGAGPAGLKAAEVLANNGRDVLVLEQKKVIGDKVCAGGLTLKDFDLGIPEKAVSRKFKSLLVHTPHQTTKITDKKFFLATIDRKALGRWMAKKARKAGAEIRTEKMVSRVGKDYVAVGKEKIRFNYLIGADGSNSTVRKSLGLKDDMVGIAIQYKTRKMFRDMEIFSDVKKFGAWYAWIFPHKNFTMVGVGTKSKGILKVGELRKNFDEWCKGRFDIKKAKFMAHTIRAGYGGYKFGNRFLVGDAGGFASALTGEGMYFAMITGIDAAMKIINPKYKCRNIEHALRVKKVEDSLAMHMEKHQDLAKVEVEAMVMLLKSKWIDRQLIEHLE